jgi:hypothetical protein
MSLQNLAKELEKKGRGKDRMLVHMTPREVSGLQAIAKAHGGSLTVNPDTGLVEAGFLDNLLPSLLPMVAGAALASTGIGAPAAAMLVGGGYGLATGSVEKGLMAGLGAYGGAGLGQGLANASTAPLEQATTAQQTVNAAQAGVIPQAPTAAPSGFQFSPSGEMVPSNYAQSVTGGGTPAFNAPEFANFQSIGSNPPAADLAAFNNQYGPTNAGVGAATNVTDAQAYNQAVGSQAGVQGGTAAPGASKGYTFNQLKSGYANTDLGQFVGDNYGKIGMAAAPVVSAAMEPEPYQEPEKKKYTGGFRLSPDFQAYQPARPNPYYRPTGLGYAEGGGIMDIALARGGSFDDEMGVDEFSGGGQPKKPAKAKLTGARNMAVMDPYEASMAELNNARYGANMSQMTMPKTGIAGLGELPYAMGGSIGGYSDGGRMLKGPGDGMSDSIPATINRKQPARLADGEFVVPADVVSHLGNGSTDAGAKRLYGMMDKVRKARTGKKKQAPAVKAERYMPA